MAGAAVENSVIAPPDGVTCPPGHVVRLIEDFGGQHVPDAVNQKLLHHTRWAYACSCGNKIEVDKGKAPTQRQWEKLAARCQQVARGATEGE